MKKRLSKLSFDEVSNEFPVMNYSEKMACIGGYSVGDGSATNPYSYNTMMDLINHGAFQGGYVSVGAGEPTMFIGQVTVQGVQGPYQVATAMDFFKANNTSGHISRDMASVFGGVSLNKVLDTFFGIANVTSDRGYGLEQQYRRDCIVEFMNSSSSHYDPDKTYYYHTERVYNPQTGKYEYEVGVYDSDSGDEVFSESYDYSEGFLTGRTVSSGASGSDSGF